MNFSQSGENSRSHNFSLTTDISVSLTTSDWIENLLTHARSNLHSEATAKKDVLQRSGILTGVATNNHAWDSCVVWLSSCRGKQRANSSRSIRTNKHLLNTSNLKTLQRLAITRSAYKRAARRPPNSCRQWFRKKFGADSEKPTASFKWGI